MWWEHPLFIAPMTAIITVIGAYVVSWIGSQKKEIERKEKDQDLKAELEAIRIQREIDKENRLKTIEELEYQTKLLTGMAEKQEQMAADVVESVHLGNSGKSRMEAIEQDLRSQVKAADVAERHASEVSATAMQTVKDLAAAEMAAKDARIDDLQRQLTTLALALPPTTPAPSRAPMPVVLTDEAGVPTEMPLDVAMHEPAKEKS